MYMSELLSVLKLIRSHRSSWSTTELVKLTINLKWILVVAFDNDKKSLCKIHGINPDQVLCLSEIEWYLLNKGTKSVPLFIDNSVYMSIK